MGFRYELCLRFDQAVWDHHFLIRCRPMETGRQHSENLQIRIEPADTVDEVRDGFGNIGYAGTIGSRHDRLYVEARGIVRTDLSGQGDSYHPMYRFPSKYTLPDQGISLFLKETMQEASFSRMGQKELEYMMDRLYRRFVYSPGATTVTTTASDALRAGRGVCQDYAHVFISLCRLAGIPARYVAGMMLGEGASHAWAEVWLNETWLGMDPTNNRLADETYIKLTHGRDFEDSSIDRGRFLGFAAQSQEISVKVEEIL